MLFSIKTKTPKWSLLPVELKIQVFAKSFIAKYPFHASEILLDQYLKENINMDLRACCFHIVARLQKTGNSTDNNLIYIIADDYWDKIAQLITYGIGNIPGSKILLDTISAQCT